MSITKDEVKYISHLARLEIKEVETLTSQLNKILGYFQKLQELNTQGVEPTSHPVTLSNVFREDEVQTSLKTEGALSSSPQKDDNYFLVPKIIE